MCNVTMITKFIYGWSILGNEASVDNVEVEMIINNTK